MEKFKICAPTPLTGEAWGLAFVRGIATTDREDIANKLKRRGYTVALHDVDRAAEDTNDQTADVEKMTLPQLKAFAVARDIDLQGEGKKDTILRIIKASMLSSPLGSEAPSAAEGNTKETE
jgi:hypothetical protein